MMERTKVASGMIRLHHYGLQPGADFLAEVEREFPEYYQAYKVWAKKLEEVQAATAAMESLSGPLRALMPPEDVPPEDSQPY